MSFDFILHESPPAQLCFASAVAAPSFISHESPLQQHDSIEQQASVVFFWSACGVVWAVTVADATSNNPRSIARVVFLRDFILVLLFQKIMQRAGKRTNTLLDNKQPGLSGRQISRSGKHNNEGTWDHD